MYLLSLSCHGEKPKARLSIDVDLTRVAARRASIVRTRPQARSRSTRNQTNIS